jgi:hypothetical protein
MVMNDQSTGELYLPASFILRVPLSIATWQHSANFQPQPPTDNNITIVSDRTRSYIKSM